MTGRSAPRRKPSSSPARIGSDRAEDPRAFALTVGEGIRHARQTKGWTQVQLAEAAGLSGNYVARLERGELGPSLFVAHRLCETLGIDVGELLQSSSLVARSGRRRIVG